MLLINKELLQTNNKKHQEKWSECEKVIQRGKRGNEREEGRRQKRRMGRKR